MRASTLMGRAAAAGIGLLMAVQASAFDVTLDATLLGSASLTGFSRCGIFVSAAGDTVRAVGGGGLGVAASGPDDEQVDGGEEIRFRFEAGPVRGVSYHVEAASNLDGDALAGESFVTASADEEEIGVEPVAGAGTIDVSALFGDEPIESVRVTSAPDGVRIGRISYEAPPVPVSLLLLRLSGSQSSTSAATITQCGITFRGTPGWPNLGTGGIGVVGGLDNEWIDAGEELEVDFGEPVRSVRYELDANEIVGPGTEGGHFVEAFDAQGVSLGNRSASAEVDLASPSFYGEVPISRFVLKATGDQIRLMRIQMVPEPAGAGAAALLALAVLRARRRCARA